jgi:hypothetical protein
MDIKSVSSGANAYASAATQSKSAQNAQQGQQSRQLKETQQAQRSKEVQQASAKEPAPKPVTNTSGHKTGSHINVTA